MKKLFLMAAVLLTACGGPLNETDAAASDATASTAALAAKDGPQAPDRYDMCTMACRGLDEPYRSNCFAACLDDVIKRAPR